MNRPKPKFKMAECKMSGNYNKSQIMQWMAAISATLTMVSVGTVYGWTTTTLEQLKNGTGVPVTISASESSWLVSLTVIASMCGSLVGALLADTIGRKITLLCTSVFFTLGWIIIILAKNVLNLYVARTILGISVGISYTVNPMYVSEVADTNIRGALGTLIAVNVFTGSLFTCSIGPYVSYTTLGFVLLLIPAVFIFTFMCFPESPYYLAMKDNKMGAVKAIIFFKRVDEQKAHQELKEIFLTINETRYVELSVADKFKLLSTANNLTAFLIVLLLIVIQQLSGNFATIQYLKGLFSRANVGIDDNVATIIVLLVGLISCTFATLTIERAGRRRLLIVSTSFCALSHFVLSIYLYLVNLNVDVNAVNLLPLILVVLFQISYQIGLGTIPNALIGEIFPTNTKSIAAASITIFDGVLGFLVTCFYTGIENSLGIHFLYILFSGACIGGFFIVLFCVPETMNKSFVEIQEELMKNPLFRLARRKKYFKYELVNC